MNPTAVKARLKQMIDHGTEDPEELREDINFLASLFVELLTKSTPSAGRSGSGQQDSS